MTGSKYTMQLAVGLAAIGFLLIVLGWNGAASLDRVPGQMPYLISGGVAGLGLVFTGLVLALVQESRRNTSLMLAKLDEVGRAIERSGGASGGPTAVPTDGSAVIAGRTTYHQPDCNVVEGRTDLQPMTAQAAMERGLAPCRICEPQERNAG
jgi:uncharacterized membrane protein